MSAKKPTLLLIIGIPGCGKSTYAKTLDNYIIHSSDELRKELFGDVEENSRNNELFFELHKRIKNDLRSGKNVIYDATNLNRKRRIHFLSEIKNIPCKKVCHLVIAPYHICVERNHARDRKVPDEAMKRMYMSFQPPHKSEGWDDIDIILSCDTKDFEDFKISVLYNKATGIDLFQQDNHYHKYTLGEHCRKAVEYVLKNHPDNGILAQAALLHDEGKVFTRTMTTPKGEKDSECHYYNHSSVGAYNSIFYCINAQKNVDDALHISNLIYFHMHPMNWINKFDVITQSVKKRLRLQLGDELFNEIIALHEADRYAH